MLLADNILCTNWSLEEKTFVKQSMMFVLSVCDIFGPKIRSAEEGYFGLSRATNPC